MHLRKSFFIWRNYLALIIMQMLLLWRVLFQLEKYTLCSTKLIANSKILQSLYSTKKTIQYITYACLHWVCFWCLARLLLAGILLPFSWTCVQNFWQLWSLIKTSFGRKYRKNWICMNTWFLNAIKRKTWLTYRTWRKISALILMSGMVASKIFNIWFRFFSCLKL